MPQKILLLFLLLSILLASACDTKKETPSQPNIILIMSDDQGWGQTGYYDHPILATPNLVEMAKSGLRLDRFYAGAPVCSPTRASVLTGRANDRTAVYSHGQPMRLQEKTIAQALQNHGYKTAHFGKWHLNGLKGPGVPVFKEDPRNPSAFGFERWITVANFFDINPLMGNQGVVQAYEGSSSDIIVDQALDYIAKHQEDPFFVVVWYGSPHDPWNALDSDKQDLPAELDATQKAYLGEIVEMDRSIGRLRSGLKAMDLAKNTLVWFNSDNGGLPEGGKEGVGGLRGFKGSVYEGGLRVPCVIEWPARIAAGQISSFPASTMDIFPTIVDVLDLPETVLTQPVDGKSIADLFQANNSTRPTPIPFKYRNQGALIDNDFKLLAENIQEKQYSLFNLKEDPTESTDLLPTRSEIGAKMVDHYEKWLASVNNSIAGYDYENGLLMPDYKGVFWWDTPEYKPYIEQWKDRPEYQQRLIKAGKISSE